MAAAFAAVMGAAPAAPAQTAPPPPPYPVPEAPPAPQATGAPRQLSGADRQQAAPMPGTGDTDTPAAMQTAVPAQPGILSSGIMGQWGGAGITVSSLGDAEGPPAGTLDAANGGLGGELWSGTDRGAAEDLLSRLPIDTPVGAVRALARRLLLTKAAAPTGTAQQAFVTVRIRRLLDAGLIEDAANLAAMAQIRNDPGFARVQADAILFAGRSGQVCSDATAARLASAQPFWVELRAYCYAVAGNAAALSLTRSVMDAQGIADDAFDTLLDDVQNHAAKAPDNIAAPTALHAFLLGQAGLPVGYDTGSQLGVPGLLLAMRNPANAPQDRLKAAEHALSAGAVSPQDLMAIADAQHFTADQFATEHAQVAKLSFLEGQALLRQAVARAAPDARPALIYEALRTADAQGLLPVAAALQHAALAQIQPTRDMREMADLMGRALLLEGDADAAARWYGILDFNLASDKPLSAKFQMLLDLVAANPARQVQAQQAYGELAKETVSQGAGQAFAALALGLGVALQQPMAPQAQAQSAVSSSIAWPGRRPAPNLTTRLAKALDAPGRKGEALMLVLNAIGTHGPGDLAPDVAIGLVRDLTKAGASDAAHDIALAALLLYKPAPPPPAAPPTPPA